MPLGQRQIFSNSYSTPKMSVAYKNWVCSPSLLLLNDITGLLSPYTPYYILLLLSCRDRHCTLGQLIQHHSTHIHLSNYCSCYFLQTKIHDVHHCLKLNVSRIYFSWVASVQCFLPTMARIFPLFPSFLITVYVNAHYL